MYPRWTPCRLTYLFVIVILPGSESLKSFNAECAGNITLPCDAAHRTKQYRSVFWYKVAGNRSGIIRRTGGEVKPYPGARTAWFEAGESLFIPSIGPEDSGLYECFLHANLNYKNEASKVHLFISECVTFASPVSADSTPEALTTVTGVNTSHHLSIDQVEVSLVMIITGFSVVAFAKIILCALSVWVLLVISKRKERRMNQWT
ncbi:hypothetical protein GJAV_G00193720 [Gymnothorax javanicus]|nr:hypothetical protein GJAV_G00193720 [Gymnothorax javanicus]